jgi:DNA-binding LacI/PurR family transcriptional regulator
VGVVVAKGSSVLTTSHRGETKAGDHAEFIALEKKLQGRSLAGCTVYTTLEPCTCRSPPKIACAKRLIDRKVSRVVVGQLDPNQEITGKGVLELRNSSIAVDLFPPDLMAQLEDLNRDFSRFHAHRPRRKRVAVAVSAFKKEHFFGELLRTLLLHCALRGYEAVVKLPSTNYSPAEQAKTFAELTDYVSEYDGAIIVPIEPEKTRAEISSFVERFKKPVVFMDLDPFPDRRRYPSDSCFVGYDNERGGRMAAAALVAEIGKKGSPRILVIGAEAQGGRQESFCRAARRLIPRVRIDVSVDGHFERGAARRVAHDKIGRAAKLGDRYSAVFTTNDEMALGVLDTLESVPSHISRGVVVVGFDGIREAVDIIDQGSRLVATVRQDSYKMADEVVGILAGALAGNGRRNRTLLDPELHHPRRVGRSGQQLKLDAVSKR